MNISQEHTPGPWIVDLRTGCFAILKQTDKRTCLCGANDDAIVFQNGRGKESSPGAYRYLTDEQEANARLIAAAPELLAALEAAREFIIDGMAMGFVGMPEDENILEVIESAIRKAKGGSK